MINHRSPSLFVVELRFSSNKSEPLSTVLFLVLISTCDEKHCADEFAANSVQAGRFKRLLRIRAREERVLYYSDNFADARMLGFKSVARKSLC